MKQLILKELREQFKVALIGLAILAVMLLLASTAYSSQLQQAVGYRGQSSDSLQPLMRNDLLIQVSFFCGIFGALLGWLQIRAEKHPDLWAFLVHRPIKRERILWSKVAAGLLLYVAGTGLPLLGFIIFVSIPGNVAAPFEWAMALPLTAIFLGGMIYYFAGLLTALRQARWFASRGFGLGVAVVANLSLFALPEFWHALSVILVAGTLVALTVWGSFQTGGYYRDQPAAGKVALTVVSTVSVMILLSLFFVVAEGFPVSRGSYTFSYFQLAKDGAILKITQRGFDEADIVDLKGQPVLDEKTGLKIKPQDMQARYATGLSASVEAPMGIRNDLQFRESFFQSGRFFSMWRVQDKILWYLTVDGRLVAYDGTTRRFTGTLLPQGASVGGAANDSRFLRPQNYGYPYPGGFRSELEILASARTAYRVDLEKRELKPLFTVPSGDAIGGLSEGASPSAPTKNNSVLILTRTAIRLLDFEGRTNLHLPYVPAHPEYPSVIVFWLEPTNTFAVRFDPDYLLNKKSGGKLLIRVEWVNPDGGIRNTMDLPKLPEPTQDSLVERFSILLLPPAISFWIGDEPFRTWNLLSIIPAILCAGFGWWLGRRNNFAFKAQAGWGIFHLLFGLPGVLVFLAVQEWPARETCPGCKKRRVVDREKCEHCGANFAPPEKTGTEIFEPLNVV